MAEIEIGFYDKKWQENRIAVD